MSDKPASPSPRLVIDHGETQEQVDAFLAKIAGLRGAFAAAEQIDHYPQFGGLETAGTYSLFRLGEPSAGNLIRISIDFVPGSYSPGGKPTFNATFSCPDVAIVTEPATAKSLAGYSPADPLPWFNSRLDLWEEAARSPIPKSAFDTFSWSKTDAIYDELVRDLNAMRVADNRPPMERLHFVGTPYHQPSAAFGSSNTTPTILSPFAADFIASRFPPTIHMKTLQSGKIILSHLSIFLMMDRPANPVAIMKSLRALPMTDEPFFIDPIAERPAA